ncbi:hypothetical protein BGW36DRAFT_421576 [Talaromyces proteolyticus]|uniref:Uncharacterized protein n=1 Tax=Talaromyces proteolyticus TaxID=1131652 RepID=A0AAD4Q647_9EURO|nr:uncharacterized protein BGW36DRAFT_421576 [Talaromyces proteolyticus]KAH8704997.1 hypothetical protein BGW36DRAFT_421576 [Talaromyces proteolyticus]
MSNPKASGLPKHVLGIALPQYVFGIQAVPLLASGIYALLCPLDAASLPNSPLQGVGLGTIQAMSLTTISLGTCQAVASYQNNIPMMIATIPGRFLAAFVFWRSGGTWQSAAPFEAFMGLLTAGSIWWYYRTSRPARKMD